MERKKLLRTVGGVLILGNLLLALMKTGVWVYTDSLSIQSEAVNSWVDTVYSFVVFAGIYLSTRDANDKYPEGHHRVEPFVSIVVGLAIVVTGIAVANNAIQTILSEPENIKNVFVALSSLVVTAAAKYLMYLYTINKEKDIKSPLLLAVAKDNRNDLLTVLVAFVGIVGYNLGLTNLDAVAAFSVSVAIAYSGIEVLYENTGYILGRSVSEGEKERIIEAAMNHKSVRGVHDVQIHYSGPKVDISMHLEVDGGITIEESHDIETTVGTRHREASEDPVNEINLHIDPYTLKEWKEE
jgi:cation diffusion facilitator family transporter